MCTALGSILKYPKKDSWVKPEACSTHLQKSHGHGGKGELFSIKTGSQLDAQAGFRLKLSSLFQVLGLEV